MPRVSESQSRVNATTLSQPRADDVDVPKLTDPVHLSDGSLSIRGMLARVWLQSEKNPSATGEYRRRHEYVPDAAHDECEMAVYVRPGSEKSEYEICRYSKTGFSPHWTLQSVNEVLECLVEDKHTVRDTTVVECGDDGDLEPPLVTYRTESVAIPCETTPQLPAYVEED